MNDKERYEHIVRHYIELCDEVIAFNEETSPNERKTVLKKAIYMDLFQIGEHIGKLSPAVRNKIKPLDVKGIISIRNIIGHGYQQVDPEIIWDTIEKDCPRLIKTLKKLFE